MQPSVVLLPMRQLIETVDGMLGSTDVKILYCCFANTL